LPKQRHRDKYYGERNSWARQSGRQSSVTERACSEAEWQTRVDLAACYRLVELYGMSDMIANHISARVPGEEGAFLINAYGMLYEEITASSLLKVDHDGKILSSPDFGPLNYGVNKAGYVVHSAVHAALELIEIVRWIGHGDPSMGWSNCERAAPIAAGGYRITR